MKLRYLNNEKMERICDVYKVANWILQRFIIRTSHTYFVEMINWRRNRISDFPY